MTNASTGNHAWLDQVKAAARDYAIQWKRARPFEVLARRTPSGEELCEAVLCALFHDADAKQPTSALRIPDDKHVRSRLSIGEQDKETGNMLRVYTVTVFIDRVHHKAFCMQAPGTGSRFSRLVSTICKDRWGAEPLEMLAAPDESKRGNAMKSGMFHTVAYILARVFAGYEKGDVNVVSKAVNNELCESIREAIEGGCNEGLQESR